MKGISTMELSRNQPVRNGLKPLQGPHAAGVPFSAARRKPSNPHLSCEQALLDGNGEEWRPDGRMRGESGGPPDSTRGPRVLPASFGAPGFSLALWLAVFGSSLTGPAAELPTPLPTAHAHNDYEHTRPLLDALDQGFCSVEADIHLVEGKLLVAHDRWKVQPERTLEALYLDPLRERVRRHGGRVYPGGPEFFLLIDFKSDGAATWPVLKGVVARYAEMLTEFSDGGIRTNAVTIVLSGNSPRELLAAEPTRLAGIDGRLPDLDSNPPVTLVPWISESWSSRFEWRGSGPLPAADQEKLATILTRAHGQGRKVRFWATPDFDGAWRLLREAGVDLINTDRLPDLRRVLLEAGE